MTKFEIGVLKNILKQEIEMYESSFCMYSKTTLIKIYKKLKEMEKIKNNMIKENDLFKQTKEFLEYKNNFRKINRIVIDLENNRLSGYFSIKNLNKNENDIRTNLIVDEFKEFANWLNKNNGDKND